MAKKTRQSISYPLRVYDPKLWRRILKKAKDNDNSINKEIEIALMQYAPEPEKTITR